MLCIMSISFIYVYNVATSLQVLGLFWLTILKHVKYIDVEFTNYMRL